MPTETRSPARTAARVAAAHGARTAATALVSAVGWPVVAVALFAAGAVVLILLATVIMAMSRMSADQATFIYQCQSRLGASVGNTASVQVITQLAAPPTPGAAPTLSYERRYLQPQSAPTSTPPPAAAPSSSTAAAAPQPNPYAGLTAPPGADARTAACVQAVKTGEFVAAPARSPGTDVGRRAAELAARQVGLLATSSDGGVAGPTNQAFSAANLVRYVYYQSSRGSVIMPETLAAQIGVGDRVDPSAISPGDLVYSAFTPEGGPTVVMIALSGTDGVDATTVNHPISVAPLPTGNVIVKRPHTEKTR